MIESEKMSINRKHFHTFDALRFFSFLLVFFLHIPFSNSSLFSFFTKSGGIGVTFFFALSGFLITYILLYEKTCNGRISLKKFFIRRILRIWPLFYAMIFFAFITPHLLESFHLSYSNQGYKPNWLMSILFLENYKMMFTGSFPNVSPLRVMWSLCIEEHFYIVWGILISIIPLKKVPHLILGSILFANLSRIIYARFGIENVDLFSNIDYFAYGAIPAYILVLRSEILNKVEKLHPSVKYFTAFITVVLVFGIPNMKTERLSLITPLIFGVLFSMIIVFTLPQRNFLRIKDNLWISKMGKYTYGLYLFHTIIINLFLHLKESFSIDLNGAVFSILSLLCTILISIMSYHFFEKQFLKLKTYFY